MPHKYYVQKYNFEPICTDLTQEYDEDGSGFISKKELQQWMMKTGKSLTESQTDRLLFSIDFNNDGCIDYREFLIIVIRRIISANAYK